MTDREVIATFMEPSPKRHPNRRRYSAGGYWRVLLTGKWIVPFNALTLDRLWEVEARLTRKQVEDYCAAFAVMYLLQPIEPLSHQQQVDWDMAHLHASSEQKIKALAAVLRPLVEGMREMPEVRK